jgi:hypothetical protein
MKRHHYETLCDKRKDQVKGFWLFLGLNALTLPIFWNADSDGWFVAMPWVINGIVLLAGLVLRPHIAVGYLVSLAGLIAVSLLYLASCWVACSAYDSGGGGDFSMTLALICPALVFPAWLIWAAVKSRRLIRQACQDGGDGELAV